MTRPSGLGNIAVQWTITQNDNNLTRPLSLTYNGVTIEGVMAGSWGSDRQEPMIGFLRIERPNRTSLPNCNPVIVDNLEFRGFTPTSTTLTSNTFTISYQSCQGFIAPDPPSFFHSETSQLTLNKQ